MTSVIIIDDDLDMVKRFADLLQAYGIIVLDVGTNGKDAVDLYRKHTPDVMLTDIQMPDYDGLYALKEIRAFDPDAKVILVTADLRESTEESLIAMKASSVVYKPYDIKQVLDTINGVVNGTLEMSEI
jgi:CheY-like chemotaxis protein